MYNIRKYEMVIYIMYAVYKHLTKVNLFLSNIHNKFEQHNEEQCCERLKKCVFERKKEMAESENIQIENN